MEIQDAVSQDETEVHERESSNTFSSLVKDFCDYTTAHGMGRIMAATHWTRTVLWTMLLLGATTIMMIQVHTLFKKYQRRPLSTLITVETSKSHPFPTVTFCNFNAIKNSTLQTAKITDKNFFEEFELFRIELEASNDSLTAHNRKRRANIGSLSNENDDDDDDCDDDDDYDDDDDPDDDYSWDEEYREFDEPAKKEPRFLKSEKMAVFMAKKKASFLSKMGHSFEDMVLSCTYRGVPCRNFTSFVWKKFWHYKYGNCYVFNSGKIIFGANQRTLKSNKPGPSHGLNLELNIEQEDYIGVLTPEAGIRMDITTQGEMPFPLERGVSLAPGYATMIGLRKQIINRKDPFDSKRCLKTVSSDESNLYSKHFGAVYSQTACTDSCLAYNQLKECGCTEYRFPGSASYGICNVTDKHRSKCLSKVQMKFRRNKLNCTDSCPPPCREEGFRTSTSFALWPSDRFEPIYTKELENKEKLVTKDGSRRENVCKLQVFYEELHLEVITERRSYEIEDFVSDIGGQLGLWIGFSVLTVVEFLELFMLLFHAALKICRAKKTAEPDNKSYQI